METKEIISVFSVQLEDLSSPCRETETWFSTIMLMENIMREKLSGLREPMEKEMGHSPASCSKMETLSFMIQIVMLLGLLEVMANVNMEFW